MTANTMILAIVITAAISIPPSAANTTSNQPIVAEPIMRKELVE